MYKGNELWKKYIPDQVVSKRLPSGKRIETFPDLPDNLYEAVVQNAQKWPEKLAVEDNLGNRFTYRELKDAADKLASAFRYRFGIQRKDHVGVMLYSSAEFCTVFLALVKLGAAAVMFPTKFRKTEIHALAEKVDLQFVICDRDYQSYFENVDEKKISMLVCHSSKEGFSLTGLMENEWPEIQESGSCEDIAVMMFTSGTTSLSKGVLLSNYNLMHAAAVYQKIFCITERDSTVIPVPIYMITGLSALFGVTLFAGGTVYLQQFFNAAEVLQCVRAQKVTFMHAAPTVYTLLLEKRAEFPKLPKLRLLACGGGRVSRKLIEKIHDWLPDCEFRTVYGMTETSSPATILPENAVDSPEMESDGIPIPGMVMKAVDDTGQECMPGQRGEILMKGTNLLRSYYHLESPLYEGGWLRTGDVGYFTEEGYCYVVGREKDMINRGGEKIIGSDVEKELLAMEGVEEAAVIGIADELYGEVPAAVVRQRAPGEWSEDGVKQYLRKRMAGYKVPVRIRFVDRIPLTPNGKYDRKNMADLFTE